MNDDISIINTKAFKRALKNEVSPLLIGLRNEIRGTNELVVALAKTLMESGKIPIQTNEELKQTNILLAEIVTESKKKDSEDWTFEVGKELVSKIKGEKGADGKRGLRGFRGLSGKTPKRGVDYFTESDIQKMLKMVTPKKGRDYFDGETKTVIVKDETKISAYEVRDKLESLKGKDRLKISAIHGLKEALENAMQAKAGGGLGGAGNITQSGGGSFITLSDAPSSYTGQALKGVRVNSGANALEFYTIAGDTDEKAGVQSDDTAGYLKDKVVSGSGITATVLGSAGARTLSISTNESYAHVWTAVQTTRRDSLGTTTQDGWVVDNQTNATSGNQQVSPAIKWRGRGYKTSSVAGSQTVDFISHVLPVQGSLSPSGIWKLKSSINGGTSVDHLWVDSLNGGLGVSFYTPASQSNGTPGTTRIASFNNTGSNTWIDFNFSGTNKSNIGANSTGGMDFYASGGNYFGYYNKNTSSLFSYNYPDAFAHYGYGEFYGGVVAGGVQTPTSKLQSLGGLALKVKRLTTSGSLDDTATHWLLDATTAQVCTGTPTHTCSHWTNEGDCIANDAHGGPCSWYAGSPCSAFNYEYGMSTCGSTGGCSADTSSCSGAGDQSTCEAQDDSYGGNCVWNSESTGDCSVFNGDESTCGSTSGCSTNYSACSWDGMTCYGGTGCDSYFDEWSCTSAMYFSGCTGTYVVTPANCSGSFYTGNCSGSYGSGCSGTSSCAGIDDSTSCGAESGCTWSAVLNANLPDGETCPDRTYWIANDSSGGADVVLMPVAGQTVDGSSTYTLPNYKDWIHIAYYKKLGDCADYSGNESTCTSTAGCTAGYYDCSSHGDSESCTADGHCSWNGATCDGGSYFGYCYGNYVISKNWYKFGS